MMALVRTENNAVEVREVPVPAITAPDQARVRVKAAAVCTTDLAIVSGAFGGNTPRILGHEIAGEVAEIGSAVGNVAIGDHVVLQPTIYCGHCPSCQEGHWHLCPRRRFIGLDVDGGFAETLVVPALNLVKAPPSIPFRYACLVEPLACVLHALDNLGAVPQQGVIITGAGVSAYLFAAVLIERGLSPERILISGRRDRRLAIIKGLGAHTVDVRRATLSAAAEHVFKTGKPEVLIDQTGDPQLLREALDMITRRGTLFIYDFTGHDIPFNFGALQLREITIKTSTGCPGDTMSKALHLIEQGLVMEPLLTHVYAPADMHKAFAILNSKDNTHVKSIICY